jgi:hypothetical protein
MILSAELLRRVGEDRRNVGQFAQQNAGIRLCTGPAASDLKAAKAINRGMRGTRAGAVAVASHVCEDFV